jgi:hypothetical protein
MYVIIFYSVANILTNKLQIILNDIEISENQFPPRRISVISVPVKER